MFRFPIGVGNDDVFWVGNDDVFCVGDDDVFWVGNDDAFCVGNDDVLRNDSAHKNRLNSNLTLPV